MQSFEEEGPEIDVGNLDGRKGGRDWYIDIRFCYPFENVAKDSTAVKLGDFSSIPTVYK